MLDAPIGAAAFNNEFGRPGLGGFFRVYEQTVDGVRRGYHKPIMSAGGLGTISADMTGEGALPGRDLARATRRARDADRYGWWRRVVDGCWRECR
jgi:phosphoribosylformylglycinamidine synthase